MPMHPSAHIGCRAQAVHSCPSTSCTAPPQAAASAAAYTASEAVYCSVSVLLRFRMKGKGIPYLRSKSRGDQYVTVNVEVPRNLTQKQKDILRNFDEDKNYKQKKSFAEKMKDFLK